MATKEPPHATTLRYELRQAEEELPALHKEVEIYGTLAATQTQEMLRIPSRVTVGNLNTTKRAFDNAYKAFLGGLERCEVLRKRIREAEEGD